MEFAPDGRLFVCQQGGQLRVIKNGLLLATPFPTVTVDNGHGSSATTGNSIAGGVFYNLATVQFPGSIWIVVPVLTAFAAFKSGFPKILGGVWGQHPMAAICLPRS